MLFYRLTLFLLSDWSEERAFSVPILWGAPRFAQQAQVVIVKEKGEIVTDSAGGSVCVGRDLGKHKWASLETANTRWEAKMAGKEAVHGWSLWHAQNCSDLSEKPCRAVGMLWDK